METLVQNYAVLRVLSPEMVANIKLIAVYVRGNNCLLVTGDDQVYSFGNYNEEGRLGLDHNNPVHEPTVIPELSGQRVVSFAFGDSHVMALTKSGRAYAWGFNKFGQLGDGTTNRSYKPKPVDPIGDGADGEQLVDICCGNGHSLALTESGEMYAWGRNNLGQIGNSNNNDQLSPVKVNVLDPIPVTAIACGSFHSLALLKSGHVFAWGHNKDGQLGIGNNDNHNIPVRVDCHCLFQKLICGTYHTLLLSADGDVYAFGCNNYGQIGNGGQQNQNSPVRVAGDDERKFTDIAASNQCNISVALSDSGRCLVWGQCNYEGVATPRETPIGSFHEVFATYTTITYKPVLASDVTASAAAETAGESSASAVAADSEANDVQSFAANSSDHQLKSKLF